MTKQGYINYRRGAAAFKAGVPFTLQNSHEWMMGYLNAERQANAAGFEGASALT